MYTLPCALLILIIFTSWPIILCASSFYVNFIPRPTTATTTTNSVIDLFYSPSLTATHQHFHVISLRVDRWPYKWLRFLAGSSWLLFCWLLLSVCPVCKERHTFTHCVCRAHSTLLRTSSPSYSIKLYSYLCRYSCLSAATGLQNSGSRLSIAVWFCNRVVQFRQ